MAPDRTLTDADVEAIAHRLADLEREPDRWMDVRAVAAWLNVSPDWVRDHAGELGGVRIGGKRGPLRFDRHLVRAALADRTVPVEPVRKGRRPGRRQGARSEGVDLLPLPSGARR